MEPDIVTSKLLEICSWHKNKKKKIKIVTVNKNELMSLNEGAFAEKKIILCLYFILHFIAFL